MLLAPSSRCFTMAACLAVATFNAAAEVSIEENHRYYYVTGDSTKELRKSIDKKRDRTTGLKGFDASTHWAISWTFKYIPTQAGCQITEATVTLEIEYRLPQWRGRNTSNNAELVRAWDTYSDNLYHHESEHGNIAKATAKDIEASLLNQRQAHVDCQDLQTQANKVASQWVTESRQRHNDFDHATDHGADTGATFP